MRGGRAVLTSLALALPAFAALLAAPASSAQGPEEVVPGTEAMIVGALTPTLQFTHEDFQKGFSRTYAFPGPRDEFEFGQRGDRGGTIKLTYVPAPHAPLQVKLEYWEVYDCTVYEDEPKTQKVTYTWSDDLMPSISADPDGVFPAAYYHELFADVKRSRSGHCDVDQGGEGYMSITLKLVHTNPQTGAVHRTAYLMLDDFPERNAKVFAGPPSEGEVEVAVTPPTDYEGWMPAGVVTASDAPGKQLTIHVKVHQKDDAASTGRAQLRFGFTEVSREKGVCLNWPATGADTKPDLRLRFTDESLGQPSADGTSIETSGLVEELELIVESFDFGAWGTLRISGKDKNKRDVIVRVRDKQNPDLTIPLDEDGNRVADAWMPEAAGGKSADSDDEHQPGNPNDGDGLTLYEEYRGFVEGGELKQGDPTIKDFFIQNLIGAAAEPGIDIFRRAALLNVHYGFTEQELDWERIINRYSSSGRKQHGVVLALHQPGADPGYSEAIGGPGPPAKVSPILITSEKTPMDYEVAHELLHACNVAHHGENDKEVRWVAAVQRGALTEKDCGVTSRITAFTENNDPLDWDRVRERGSLRVLIPAQGGQLSGAEDCLMRYVYGGLVARIDSADSTVRRLTKSGPSGTKLCRSGAGTGINATNKGWGDSARGRGNCFGQIHVNDSAPANEKKQPPRQECN